MGINSINGSNIDNINPNIDIDKVKEDNSIFGKISAGSSQFRKPNLDIKDNVKGGDIKEHSLAETPETAKMEDIQNTVEIKKTPGGGTFGGFKIGAGKPSDAMKNTIGNGSNVKDHSLENRV
jgi:hypothetical protein